MRNELAVVAVMLLLSLAATLPLSLALGDMIDSSKIRNNAMPSVSDIATDKSV